MAYGKHPLDGYTIIQEPSPCFTPGRAYGPVDHVTTHHCAGLGWPNFGASRGASSTWGVWKKQIKQYVHVDNTPWTDGNAISNATGETIESVNAWGEPDWGLDEETFDTTARLTAAIHIRRGWRKAKYTGGFEAGTTLYQHRDLGLAGFSPATRCPGEWFRGNYERFVRLVNGYLDAYYEPAPDVKPAPKPEPEPDPTPSNVVSIARWDNPQDYMFNTDPTTLWSFDTKPRQAVKTYASGGKISLVGEAKTPDGKRYYISEYSFERKISNGFDPSELRLLHSVKKGETLWGIAKHYDVTVDIIVAENHIANPNFIVPGQLLKIKVKDE